MAIYDSYAAVYDASGQSSFSRQILPYLESLLARHPVRQGALLELACGTGTVALAMAERGWRVYGVDASAQMLAEARRKAEQAPPMSGSVLWLQQDMRQVTLDEPVSLATCLYDSLNYMLTSEDLLAVFKHVLNALEPGGLFVFDMNTVWAFENYCNDQAYVSDGEEFTVIMQTSYDWVKKRAHFHVIIFRREGDLYRKTVEHHIEQAYPPEYISTLLTDVGFQVEGVYRCFTFEPPNASSPRILWVARKPPRPA